MLFCTISGEDAQEGDQVPNLRLNDSLSINYSESSPIYREQTKKMYNETSFNNIESQNSIANSVEPMDKMVSVRPIESTVFPPPPPSYFLGYTLPPGHPCNSFTLPPPPADKKRTGPRRKLYCFFPFFFVFTIAIWTFAHKCKIVHICSKMVGSCSSNDVLHNYFDVNMLLSAEFFCMYIFQHVLYATFPWKRPLP